MKFKFKKLPITEFLRELIIFDIFLKVIFFIFLFPLRKINRLFSTNEGAVIIVALHKLGDTLFTIPAISEVRKKYRKNCVIVCYSSSVPIYNLAFRDVEYFVVNHEDFYFQERIAKGTIKKKLKSFNPFIIFDLTGWIISASLIYNIRAKEIIGININQFRAIYDKFVQPRMKPKLTDIYLDAISPVIKIEKLSEYQTKSLKGNLEGSIIIHPFAGWNEKQWNLKKFMQLAQRLNQNYYTNILLPYNSLNTDIYQEILYSKIDIIETSSSEELIKEIKKCSLFIGNDSGPVNIANFLGKPTFTIYGCTNPDYTTSGADYQSYIQKKLNCSAKSNEKYCLIGADLYYCPGTQCMNLLTVDDVYARIILLAEKYCKQKVA